MAELVTVSAGDGSVLFEGDYSRAKIREIGIEDRVEDFVGTVGAEASTISDAVKTVIESVRDGFAGFATDHSAGGTLAGLEVEFGLKISGEGNFFVAKGGAEANLAITVTWDFKE
jgi:hypothetical protein